MGRLDTDEVERLKDEVARLTEQLDLSQQALAATQRAVEGQTTALMEGPDRDPQPAFSAEGIRNRVRGLLEKALEDGSMPGSETPLDGYGQEIVDTALSYSTSGEDASVE